MPCQRFLYLFHVQTCMVILTYYFFFLAIRYANGMAQDKGNKREAIYRYALRQQFGWSMSEGDATK